MTTSYFGLTIAAGTYGTNSAYRDITLTGCAVGDLIVVFGISEQGNNSGANSATTQAGTTSAWTTVYAGTDSGSVGFGMFRATASSAGSITVRVAIPTPGTASMMVGAFLTPAAEWTGAAPTWTVLGPNVASALLSVTVAATARVLYAGGDWAAGGDPGTGISPAGGTVDDHELSSGSFDMWVGHWAAQAAGTRNYGPSSAPGACNDWLGGVLAIPEAAGGTPATVNLQSLSPRTDVLLH